ncbi:MAG: hypothetical protein RSE32_14525 [Comamonas sp.]|uniref:hypothetical protein n=1 Tax=Comamonas sp. TaxID=34028 RepID=UPI002FCB2B30
MITVQITPETPSHMLRAIRAACNELLGETVELRLPTAAVQTLETFAAQEQAEGREPSLSPLHAAPYGQDNAQIAQPQPFEEVDSAGQPWNAELHASTKSKNADGTWKKRRGAALVAEDPHAHAAPPMPPAAPTAEPIMPKIFALITSQIVTINQAVEAAQAEGFADLGANGLGGAPVEKQLAVLRKLEAA